MQTVINRGAPPNGAHWSMGADHMVRISRGDADKLLTPFGKPLPRMGYETDVTVKRDGFGFPLVLTVQNMSGDFYLASCHAKVSQWPDVFGVTVKG